MKKAEITDALITIHQLLNEFTKPWLIIGTASLYLQGFTVKPKDVDILCSTDDASFISEFLSPYKKHQEKNISRDKFRSAFSRYEINGIVVEVMGGLEVNTETSGWVKLLDQIKCVEEVLFNGLTFKVPSKIDQVTIYQLFGRLKDQQTLELLNATEYFNSTF